MRPMSPLKRARLARGLTQQDMADQLGIARPTLANYEVGRYRPSLVLANRIARTLQLPIDQLFFAESVSESDADGSHPIDLSETAK